MILEIEIIIENDEIEPMTNSEKFHYENDIYNLLDEHMGVKIKNIAVTEI